MTLYISDMLLYIIIIELNNKYITMSYLANDLTSYVISLFY